MKKKEYIIPAMRAIELRHRSHLLNGSPMNATKLRGVESPNMTNEEDNIELGGAGVWEVR